MYEVGRVYIWQCQVGVMAHLNGTECTVTGPARRLRDAMTGKWYTGQPTDSPTPHPDLVAVAMAGDLRPKNPPSGEQRIRDLFKPAPPEIHIPQVDIGGWNLPVLSPCID